MAQQESKKRKGNIESDNSEVEGGVFMQFVDLSSKYICNDFKDIAQCFTTLHQNISKDLTSISTRLSDVKTDLQDVKESVEINAQDIESLKLENESLKSDIEKMGKSFMARAIWSRKWNLIFRGIQGQLK